MFGSNTFLQADVVFRANTAQFAGDAAAIRAEALRTYGALDEGALQAALASEKYDRALARSKGSAFAVAKATASYKAELGRLAAAETHAASSSGRHSGALRQEERSIGAVARGALVGSGALGHFGRAAVFASSSLLGGYGLVYALRSVVHAAQDEQVAFGHLQTTLHDTGLSWTRYGGQIHAALDAQIKATGFTNTELTESLTAFIRRFADVNTAVRTNAIAADVARARNISLADAQNLVLRAINGNVRTLRTLGVEYTKTTANVDALKATTSHATAEQLANAKAADVQANSLHALDAINGKYHGNSARFLTTDAGKQQLFNAELQRSEEIIGEALLPTFNRLLIALTAWLEKMNRSGKLQRDVTHALHDMGIALHTVEAIVGPVANDFKVLGKAVGGTKHEIEILTAALTVLYVRAKLMRWGIISGGIAGVGASAARAETETIGLRAALGRLALLDPILIPITIAIYYKKVNSLVEKIPGEKGLASYVDKKVGFLGAFDSFLGINPNDNKSPKTVTRTHIVSVKGPGGDSGYRKHTTATTTGTGDPTKKIRHRHHALVLGLSYAQQNQLLEAQATTPIGDDVSVLNSQIEFLDQALRQQGLTPEQTNELLSERNGLVSQLQSIQSASASSAGAARRKLDELHKRQHAAAVKARNQRIGRLEKPPVQLEIDLAVAKAHGASEKKILAILEQEKAALEKQVKTLRSIGASKEEILRARQNEAAVQGRIDAILKKRTSGNVEAQAFIRELSGTLGQFESNISARPGSTPNGSRPVVVEQHFHAETSQFRAMREARQAAAHIPV